MIFYFPILELFKTFPYFFITDDISKIAMILFLEFGPIIYSSAVRAIWARTIFLCIMAQSKSFKFQLWSQADLKSGFTIWTKSRFKTIWNPDLKGGFFVVVEVKDVAFDHFYHILISIQW